MNIIVAPEYKTIQNTAKVFVGGGITNCEEWQDELLEFLSTKPNDLQTELFTFYNPRRKEFDVTDPNASDEQIKWEYNYLRDADILLFWFSKETLNPITLYELGKWGNSTDKILIIGCDPEYSRKTDVKIQTELSRDSFSYCEGFEQFKTNVAETLKHFTNHMKWQLSVAKYMNS